MKLKNLYERYCRWCEQRGLAPASYSTWLEVTNTLRDVRRGAELQAES